MAGSEMATSSGKPVSRSVDFMNRQQDLVREQMRDNSSIYGKQHAKVAVDKKMRNPYNQYSSI